MAITPMWSGWNSQITEDKLPQQRVTYMDNLNLPPTRLDVIVETLKISQKVAIECGERYIVVHYDLAIAKPAMQIQFTESPKYDNVLSPSVLSIYVWHTSLCLDIILMVLVVRKFSQIAVSWLLDL